LNDIIKTFTEVLFKELFIVCLFVLFFL